MDFTISLPVTPRGKRAPKPTVLGKRVRVGGRTAVVGAVPSATKDPGTRAYERELADLIISRLPAGLAPVGLYAIDVLAVLPRPMSLRVARGYTGAYLWAPVKPDADNVVKSAQDALTVAMHDTIGDDCHVVIARVAKVRARQSDASAALRLVLRVYSPEPDPADVAWVARLINTPADNSGWQSASDGDTPPGW